MLGGRLDGRNNQKPHLLFPWIDRLIRHPRILDAVESVIGPDILCWGSHFSPSAPATRLLSPRTRTALTGASRARTW
jgi:hypothetical protein